MGGNFKKFLLAGVAAAGMAFAAADAQAAFVGSTPAINDVFAIKEGIFGANLFLVGTAVPVNATVELIGYETGAHNTFNINGGAAEFSVTGQAGTLGAPVGTTFNIMLAPGLLNFVFTTDVVSPGTVANGSNVDPVSQLPNFFVTFGATGDSVVDGNTPDGGTVLLIAFDDGGAGPDDNHDDLVIRLTLTGGSVSVPEPATLTLFGMGLLGLGMVARRRKA